MTKYLVKEDNLIKLDNFKNYDEALTLCQIWIKIGVLEFEEKDLVTTKLYVFLS